MAKLATRIGQIQPFHVMEILAQAKALEATGRSVIHMEIGEPDFSTPQPIIQAGMAALQQGKTHYTQALGIMPLKEALAQYYWERFQVDISPHRILLTPGASGGLLLLMGAFIDNGQEVLLADPGYPCYRHFAAFCGGIARNIPVDALSQYHLTPELIGAHWQHHTQLALVSSPCNPTGMVMDKTTLAALHHSVVERGGRLIVDEIYQGLSYAAESYTALSIDPEICVVNSFSKYFGMTGWRLGWIVVPENLVPIMDKLAQNLFLAPSTIAQWAALAAFSTETQSILEDRRWQFQQRRDYLLPQLRQLGFTIPLTPQGAFYIYANCDFLSQDSQQFAQNLLQQQGLAITPGIDFGTYQNAQHVRFSYTLALDQIEAALQRLRNYIASVC